MLFPNWSRLMQRGRIRRSRPSSNLISAEILERRTVPTVSVTGVSSVTITITGGEDVAVGYDGFDNLQVVVDGDTRTYDGSDTAHPHIDTKFVQSLTIKATKSFDSTDVDPTNANNEIYLTGVNFSSGSGFVLLSSLTVKAGGGDDTIIGSDLTSVTEVIYGGRGNDTLAD